MAGTSKAIIGAAAVMVITLAIVLTLVLVLLAELYCSLLLRRHKMPPVATAAGTKLPHRLSDIAPSSSLSSYARLGVLRAPRSFLFPHPENQTSSALSPPHRSSVREASPPSASNHHLTYYICNSIYYDRDEERQCIHNTIVRKMAGGAAESGGNSRTLSPMKKLPSEGTSVALRSICTTGSTDSNYGGVSSSSSDSHFTSPSW